MISALTTVWRRNLPRNFLKAEKLTEKQLFTTRYSEKRSFSIFLVGIVINYKKLILTVSEVSLEQQKKLRGTYIVVGIVISSISQVKRRIWFEKSDWRVVSSVGVAWNFFDHSISTIRAPTNRKLNADH